MKNTQLLTLAVASMLVSKVSAITGGVYSGDALTTGHLPDHFSVYSASINPAAAALVLNADESWRMGYLPSLSASMEIGAVDNFYEELEDLSDIIDDPSITDVSTSETLDRFNRLLEQMGQDGYVRVDMATRLPFTPLFFKVDDLPGTFSVDVNASFQGSARLLDEELFFDGQNQSFSTQTSFYTKSGIETELSLGYGQSVWRNNSGQLYAGVKAKIITLDLSKQTIRLMDLDSSNIEDVLEDEYDANRESTTNFGLDFGVVWDARRYRLGLTLANANAPSFDYGSVGTNCAQRAPGSIERNGCEVARSFVSEGRLRQSETHTKNALLTADAMYFLTHRWSLGASYDFSAYNDAVGFEHQWFNVSTSYRPEGRWLPGVRFGYQTNQVGTQLDLYNFGVTFFKTLNFDVQYNNSEVVVDDHRVPRQLGFALSFSESF